MGEIFTDSKRCVIVGLGNPGSEYAETRHNLGFKVVQEFAEKRGWAFKKESRFKGKVAQGNYGENPLCLLLPLTYMNLSGEAIRKVVDYYRIPYEEEKRFLVIVDDVYLKFGTLRMRSQGSSGGHNGLKSIELHLQTQHYSRLRMGVGPNQEENLPDGREMFLKEYVLGSFTKEEKEKLPNFIAAGVTVIERWLELGIEAAMRAAGEASLT